MKIKPFIAVGLLFAALAPWLRADDVTFEKLQQMFREQKYQPMLVNMSKILSDPTDAAKRFNLHDLYSLKAEAHLRLKDGRSATQALTEAAKHAQDREQAAIDKATVILIQRSGNLRYTPKQPGGPAIDIVEPDRRGEALVALYNDELTAQRKRIGEATREKTIPPILKVIGVAQDLVVLEMAGRGSKGDAAKLLNELSRHTESLLSDAVEQFAKRERELYKSASTKEREFDMATGQYHESPRGLSVSEEAEARRMMNECTLIGATLDDLVRKYGLDSKDFSKIVKRSEGLLAALKSLCNEYGTRRPGR